MILFLLKSQTVTLAKVVFKWCLFVGQREWVSKEILQWPEMKLAEVAHYSLVNSRPSELTKTFFTDYILTKTFKSNESRLEISCSRSLERKTSAFL